MRYDELGRRIKSYEQHTTIIKLMKNLPFVCRIDGRCFHSFCKGLTKPYCFELVETMQAVCSFLVDKFNADLGYTQSDEITLGWLSSNKAPFDGKLFKLQSVLASLATSKFVNYINYKYNTYHVLKAAKVEYAGSKAIELAIQDMIDGIFNWEQLYDKCQKLNPSFDCRVFQLPNEIELANTFVWREIDAVRNSVSMLAQANFSHKELQGKDRKAMLTMLEEKGIRWNELRDDLKRGAYFRRVLVEKELDDETWNKIPDDKKPESRIVKRSEIRRYDIPEMKNVENKVGVYFYNEDPKEKVIDVWYIQNKTMGYETRCSNCNKKHYFSTAGDNILCSCGIKLHSKKLSTLGSLENYNTEFRGYSEDGEISE